MARTPRFPPALDTHQSVRATAELVLIELGADGADGIELGAPFSDAVAVGEVIRRASRRALRNGDTHRDAVTCVGRARDRIGVPVVVFSYLNPRWQFGEGRL